MIEIKNFSHFYGKTQVVHDLSLDINQGDIYGFIGPNGAGKTTTIRFLATLLKASHGKAFVNGIDVIKKPQQVRKIIGFMPDDFGVYENMNVVEYLEFYAMAYGIPKDLRKATIHDILNVVDLEKCKKALANKLSRGMRQRLGLARALLHDPKVLLLDEPASGLDPRGRIEIMELLKALQEMRKTIVVSSHILSELANYCNKIGIINEGRLVVQGSLEEISQIVGKHKKVELQALDNHNLLKEFLDKNPQITNLEQQQHKYKFHFLGDSKDLSLLLKEIIANDISIVSLQEVAVNLEDVFIYVTSNSVIEQ